jgi:hypothetical protein
LIRQFWPANEQSQADYEALREAVLSGKPIESLTAARFERRGLAGLIAWPRAEPVYAGVVLGADRPPWTPYADPRVEVLASCYELILSAAVNDVGVAKRRVR